MIGRNVLVQFTKPSQQKILKGQKSYVLEKADAHAFGKKARKLPFAVTGEPQMNRWIRQPEPPERVLSEVRN